MRGELDHLAGHDVRQAVDAGDAVADLQHLADFLRLDLVAVAADFLGQYRNDFVGFNAIGHSCLSR